MKKLATRILVAATALTLAFSFAACGQRELVNVSGFTTLADFNNSGAVLAAQSGTFHLDALNAQITGVTKKEYDDFNVLYTALDSDAIDGYIAEEATAWTVIEKNSNMTYVPLVNNTTGFVAEPFDTGVAIAFATGSELVAQVNTILAGMDTTTRTNLMRAMVAISNDFDNPEVQANFALEMPASTGENGTLKIGMECAYAPYNWTQTTTNNNAVAIANVPGSYANGYDVQLARYIAASLNMNLEVYSYEWDSLIPAVQSNALTAIIAGMSPTAEREEQVDFTDLYWDSNLVIICKKAA